MKKLNTYSNSKQFISALLLLLAAVIWGGAFVAQSLAGGTVGTFTFNGIRFLIGGVCLLPMMPKHSLSDISHKNKNVIGGILCGMALFLASTFQQAGIAAGADAGEAGFLTACYIIMVPILGILIGRKCSGIIWFAAGMTLIGLYLLCFSEGSIGKFSFAEILLLLCALLFSVQIICIDIFSPRMNPITLTCTEFIVSGVLSLISGFFLEYMKTPSDWIASLSVSMVWISILYTGVFSSAVGYTLQTVSQQKLHPAVASLIMSMESVFAAIFGWIILGQTMTARELAGCAIIFAAIIITQIPMKK